MNVFWADEQDEPVEPGPLVSLAERVLRSEGLSENCEVSIVLVAPAVIADYNQRFMHREGPTDVLAFPLEDLEPGLAPAPTPNGPPLVLGDLFICPPVVAVQARERQVAFEGEMALIVTHGLLHLLGYHHDEEEAAMIMRHRERSLLAEAGLQV